MADAMKEGNSTQLLLHFMQQQQQMLVALMGQRQQQHTSVPSILPTTADAEDGFLNYTAAPPSTFIPRNA